MLLTIVARAMIAVAACVCAATAIVQARAQGSVAPQLKQYRDMLAADPWANPARLDADRGEALWRVARGPKQATLEACDLGKGPGVVDGAYAELPRYFADTAQVMDLEARLVWCMMTLQGIPRATLIAKPYPANGMPASDLGAIATFVAARSSGMKFAPHLAHPQERRMLALGEALYNRRQGPFDFACATCHSADGKRIRLQELAHLSKPDEARKVVGEWPAYRVSTANTMTLQHRIYDCFWQMRLPEVELGSEVTVALIMYLTSRAAGGEIAAPGMKR